jgi:hypothetical protein
VFDAASYNSIEHRAQEGDEVARNAWPGSLAALEQLVTRPVKGGPPNTRVVRMADLLGAVGDLLYDEQAAFGPDERDALAAAGEDPGLEGTSERKVTLGTGSHRCGARLGPRSGGESGRP